MAEFYCWQCSDRTDHTEQQRGLVYKCVICGTSRDLSDPKFTGLVSGAVDCD